MLYVIIFHDELFFVTRIDYGISGVYISETVKALVKCQNCDYKSDINYIFWKTPVLIGGKTSFPIEKKLITKWLSSYINLFWNTTATKKNSSSR